MPVDTSPQAIARQLTDYADHLKRIGAREAESEVRALTEAILREAFPGLAPTPVPRP